jgi:DNA repair protein RadC
MKEKVSRGIKNMPMTERPTERLFALGPEALNYAELIAVVIRGESSLEAGMRILAENGGPGCMAAMSADELAKTGKLGRVRAAQLKAAVELGMRLTSKDLAERPLIKDANDAAEILQPAMRHLQCEEFRVILLDSKHRALSIATISTGILTSSLVHPREVFREAMFKNSAALIVAHNHPSGDPTPSKEDIAITDRLAETGRLVGIELLDHIIIGSNGFVSLRENGILGRTG